MYIRILSFFKLARVKKLPPKLAIDEGKLQVDLDTVRAVIANRFVVMSRYYKTVIRPLVRIEKAKNKTSGTNPKILRGASRLMRRQEVLLNSTSKSRLQQVLDAYERLRLAYDFKQSLQEIWLKTAGSQKELVESLQQWCRQAEQSGLESLELFAKQIRSYIPKTHRLQKS